VPGNHEFWTMWDAPLRALVESCGVTYLNNTAVTYRGVRFLGSTLWTKLPKDSATPVEGLIRHINDFANVDGLDVATWRAWHRAAWYFLVTELTIGAGDDAIEDAEEKGPNLPCVVVTHHAPSFKCIDAAHHDDPSNIFYANKLDAWLDGVLAPAAWICGHTHHPYRETIGRTLVVNNPRRDALAYAPRMGWADAQGWWVAVEPE
jgi:hypothetical protein